MKPRTVRPADVLFKMGQVFATAGALEKFTRDELLTAITRHVTGDWGDLDCCDVVDLGCVGTEGACNWHANTHARLNGGCILSSYVIGDRELWVITEPDRSRTTLLLPEEH